MEQKKLLLSALGVGVGVGLGLVSGQTVNRWSGGGMNNHYNNNNGWADGVTGDQIEHELLRLIIHGKDADISFDDFPNYIRYCFISFQTPPITSTTTSVFILVVYCLSFLPRALG